MAGAVIGRRSRARSACQSIETFAAQQVDVGTTYDYGPSHSPAELAEWTDVVVRGELAGEVDHQPASSETDDASIGYEITVDEVLAGEPPDGSDTVAIWGVL